MLITEISVKRPVFAVMMMLALVVIGGLSYFKLGIEDLPNVEFPIAFVNVVYPGASPEVIEKEIVKKIEEAINPIQGVKRITSTTYEGLTNIIVEFNLNRDKDIALQDVRDAVATVRGELPKDIDEPTVSNFDPTSVPIISAVLYSNKLNLAELSVMAKESIKKKIESSYGVGKVSILGNQEREIRVEINPSQMREKRIGVEQILDSINLANKEIPAGGLESNNISQQIRVKGKIQNPQDFNQVVVSNRDSIPIKLESIAQIYDTTQEAKTKAFLDQKPIVSFDVTKIRGSNTVKVAEEINKKIIEINKTLPKGTKLKVIKDNSLDIKESVKELTNAMLLGILLTILIVFLFLNSWRSTVITGLTLPISLIATFGVMAAFNFTLNTLSLIALSLSVGLVIDDAIVVRENIVRHLDMGKDHIQASLEGTKEIGLAVMATTFTIVAVFLPVAFMGGITGKFFYEFGITVSTAVLVSLFVSFTLDPMLSSIWKDPKHSEGEHSGKNILTRSLDSFNNQFDNLAKFYKKIILWCLNHRLIICLGTLAIFIGSCLLVPYIGSSFTPEVDKGQVGIALKAPTNMTLEYTTRKAEQVVNFLKKELPEYKFAYLTVGGGFTGEVNKANIFLQLSEKTKRKKNQAEIMSELRKKLAAFGGIKATVSAEGQAGPGGSPILISVQGENQKILEKLATQVIEKAKTVPGAIDLDSSLNKDRLNLNIQIDRQKAADLGLDLSGVSNALRTVFAGQRASYWQSESAEQYEIFVRLPKNLRSSEEVLRNIYFSSKNLNSKGIPEMISLEQIATISNETDTSKINHRNLFREISITGNVEGRSNGEVLGDLQKEINKIKVPRGHKIVFGGEAEDLQESAFYALLAVILAVIFIYLIMASQFNSFIQPLAIMITLPLALIGVFVTFFITRDTLNVISMIGVIALLGLVTKNGILLVDFANQKRKEQIKE
ncbi:MAG: efflux RND transporter permease subunit, partial [Candidatus Caenarcaniphilales bacterium]|nr:efflux RND transporter permease subunit [Candidatus Caenarcaniphilales bacterium]